MRKFHKLKGGEFMKMGLLLGVTLGAAATATVMTDIKMMKMFKKAKKSVMHKVENML